MSENRSHKIEITLTSETIGMLEACASWRKVSVEELARAYVEDWLDIDYPESQGRHTRRGIYRDGPITLDEQTRQETSSNWRDELGIGRLSSRPE